MSDGDIHAEEFAGYQALLNRSTSSGLSEWLVRSHNEPMAVLVHDRARVCEGLVGIQYRLTHG
jgi:hypothetical protein